MAAFVVQKKSHYHEDAVTCLTMAPRFDKATQMWVPTKDDEMPSAGYPPIGSFLRHGPVPYMERVFKPDEYEQAVLKFMATDPNGGGCSRNEAQGNMDAYLRNPSDWMYMRMEAQKKGIKLDYAKLDQKEIALVLVWSTVVSATVGRVIYCLVVQEQFWDFLNL